MSDRATAVVARLVERGETVAVAESLTGGLVVADLVSVPGASAVVRGALVAYAPDVKTTVLGVDPQVVAQHGTVAEQTALAMARRAREVLGADWGLATTGVAGPDASEGKAPGTVHVAVDGPAGTRHLLLGLAGGRADVRSGAVAAVLDLLASGLADPATR